MSTFDFTAIKYNDSETVLDCANEFFNLQGLSLVEVGIANRSGKYIESPKQYKDLSEYLEASLYIVRTDHATWSTNFTFFENLNKNRIWKVFAYPHGSFNGLATNENLAKHISAKLETNVIEFCEQTGVGLIKIRKHEKGALKDELLYYYDGGIQLVEGYFKRSLQDEKECCDREEELDEEQVIRVFDSVNQFLEENILFPEDEIGNYNDVTTRPMYLKGEPEKVIRYLGGGQIF